MSYLAETKEWLESRYKMTDGAGVYIAHQPIYGFNTPPVEAGVIDRYIITYQLMKHFSRLKFSSLLDVGGAEGYKSALAQSLFNLTEVHSSDISEEACRRADEIFDIKSSSVDITNLPFASSSFDVVCCSETLEHVENFQASLGELVRVARKAVLITVPMETPEFVAATRARGEMHGHIQSLSRDSFAHLEKDYQIFYAHHLCFLTKYLRLLLSSDQKTSGRLPAVCYKAFNLVSRFVRFFSGKSVFKAVMVLDRILATVSKSYGLCVLILKDEEALKSSPDKVSIKDILEFKVPHHHI